MLVKAAPVLTSALDETMCVAGARVDTDRSEWIRLHPVPFRDLADDSRFAKYQELEVDVARPKSDRRPESWSPRDNTIRLGAKLDTANGGPTAALLSSSSTRPRCATSSERTAVARA